MLLSAGLLNTAAFAQGGSQDRVIRGIVVSTTGEALTGATVTVEGTTLGTVADTNGNFSLRVPTETMAISVSLVGMTSQTVPLTSETDYRITMEAETTEISEVVVIGYGSVQKRDLSGSVANVTREKFNKGAIKSIAQLISGQVAGLVVTTPGGDPTTGATMRLRGTTSLVGGNGPLIVIDGVPDASLYSVSPQDIESVSVLKDASAASIYGARSANGVIMVTTKKGRAGSTSIAYDGYFAVESIANGLDMLSASDWRKWVKDNNIENAMDYGSDTDWANAIYRTGYSQNHNLSLTGGSTNSSYRASVNFLDQKGIAITNDLQRINASISFDQKALDDKLRVLLNANATLEDWNAIPTYNVFAFGLNRNPTLPVYDENGDFKEVSGYQYDNPVAMLNQMESQYQSNQFMGRVQVDYTFLDMFTASVNGSMTRYDRTHGTYESRYCCADPGTCQPLRAGE